MDMREVERQKRFSAIGASIQLLKGDYDGKKMFKNLLSLLLFLMINTFHTSLVFIGRKVTPCPQTFDL